MNTQKETRRIAALVLAWFLMAGSLFPALAETAAVPEDIAQTEAAAIHGENAQTETAALPAESKNADTMTAYFKEGSCVDFPITCMEEAAEAVDKLAREAGWDEQIRFDPWRTITDSSGNSYYVFRQMIGDVTVSGGAVKVVADPDGKMLGAVSSVETDIPETQTQEGIPESEAESVVAGHMEQTGHPDVQVLEGYTRKVILPVNLEPDPDSEEEKEEVRYVWLVYTDNDDGRIKAEAEENTGETPQRRSELPYLAHYVAMDGEYLYSLPTIIPDDEAGNTGFQAAYVFEFMEPAEYEGTVTLSDGTQQEIRISLMRDSRTGMYYLGNLERRIVVADCYEFLYNKGNVFLEASADNTGWDSTCLLSLYNYCRAWDYYNEIGWKGGDGLGTPIMILKDYCDKNHEPVDNAAYAGTYYGWQLFLSSSANDLSQCLDVLGHEFTHCVTGSVMTYNAYSNDYGAINEAISDIQGNLCEMMAGATQDETWELGENSSSPVRSMSTPHKYRQPEFTWDLYYRPNVSVPTDMNDRGGVHSNSSLLNRIAWLLCTEGGMKMEEARDFWFAVPCSMVPGTDYVQMSTLLPWVLANTGLDRYLSVLKDALARTGIGSRQVPETFDNDHAMLTLQLPDTESFTDGNWSLFILSVDADGFRQRAGQIFNGEGEYDGALGELEEKLLDAGRKYVFDGEEKETFEEVLTTWFHTYFRGGLSLTNGAAGTDGKTVQMVCTGGFTVPVLVNMKFEPCNTVPASYGLAVYCRGRWLDLAGLTQVSEDRERSPEDAVCDIVSLLFDKNNTQDYLFEIKGGSTCEIPADGLENIRTYDGAFLEEILREHRKSE